MHADGHDSSPLTRLSVSPPQLHVTAHRTSFFFFPFLFFKWVRFRRWSEQPPVAAKKPQPGASRGDYLSIPPCTTHSKYGHCFQCFSLYCCHLSHLAPPLPLPLLSGWLLCWCSCPLLMPKEKWPWSKSDRRNRCAPLANTHTHTHSPASSLQHNASHFVKTITTPGTRFMMPQAHEIEFMCKNKKKKS